MCSVKSPTRFFRTHGDYVLYVQQRACVHELHVRAPANLSAVQDGDIELSELSRMAVLTFLGNEGPASRATIARGLDLSPATVTQVTRRLIHQGVVEPLYFAPSDGGRPGQLLGLIGAAGRAIGVKVAADHIAVVEVRLDGQVLASTTEPFDAVATNATDKLLSSLKPFLRSGEDHLLGVGVCVPGVVRRPDVGDVDADVLGWADMPLGARLRATIDVPVLVENDVKALAVAERLYGRGKTRRSFVVITIGRGVGFASVSNGALQRGATGAAGELAHLVISSNGPKCACGQRGCLEAYVGADGLISAGRAAGALSASSGLDRLADMATRGDATAHSVFARAGQRLAHAVAPAVAALNPELIIVAGEGTVSWRHWDYAFRTSLRRRLPIQMRATPIEVDSWDDTSWARGAAAIVLATPFDRHALAGNQRKEVLTRLHGRDLR